MEIINFLGRVVSVQLCTAVKSRPLILTFSFVKSTSNEPYVTIKSIKDTLFVPQIYMTQVIKMNKSEPLNAIRAYLSYHVLSYEEFVDVLGLIASSKPNLPIISNCTFRELDAVFNTANSFDFRLKVYRALKIPLPLDKPWARPKTTAGDYICCGTSSFKPIAKARFE